MTDKTGLEGASMFCPECTEDVDGDDKYCRECGEPLTAVAQYESRPSVEKANDALFGILVLVGVVVSYLVPVVAAVKVALGDWPVTAIPVGVGVALLGYGVGRAWEKLDRMSTPDEVLRERGRLDDGE